MSEQRVLGRWLLDEDVDPPGEPGEVPVVAALPHEPLGACRIRLFDEPPHPQRAPRHAARRVDVAEPGRRKCRFQTNRHQAACGGRGLDGGAHGPGDLSAAVDDMVRRERDHHRPRHPLVEDQRGQAIGVRGAARRRLQDQMRYVDLRQDRLDDLALPHLGEHEDLVRDRFRAVVCRAKQRPAPVRERQHVFWRRAARARPQPRARAAGGNHSDSGLTPAPSP